MEYWQGSQYKVCSAWVFLVALDVFLGVTKGVSHEEINKHLFMGGEMLARGQLQDALSHYHAAVEGDPWNYLTYFKRATVYLALGKPKLAVLDFNKVLELKPDFTGARLERAHILKKQGILKEASADFYHIFQYEENEGAYHNYASVARLMTDFDKAEEFVKEKDYVAAVDLLSHLIEVCPWSSRLWDMRSECYMELGDPMAAIMDLRSTTKLEADNTDGHYRLSVLHYQLGQPQESLREIRECLKLDPEHKLCFPHYKKVKKVDKYVNEAEAAIEANEHTSCIDAANSILKTESTIQMIRFIANEKLCRCYLHDGRLTASLDACNEALKISKDPDVLCDRAETYITSEMYEDAIRDFQEVLEMNNEHNRAKEGIQRTQKLQRQAEKRDYYKILGVKRTASKREIIKAYRKAAQKWHPDNFPDGDEKKMAQKRFIDVAAAKEVLTDSEKRRKFDRGEDPLDPESGQHQGFNPFQQFHHFHHGGSPFTFKFNFN